jgi:taurine--2-oxoglutarate transaminase
VAAILLEPVTGKNGVIIPPKGYLQGVRAICDKYGIMLIADEVMTGFGRTGEWFAVNHWDVKPDLITMAKGLTSAYAPLGAVGITHEVASAFNERTFYGGLTYNGHPVSLAAAIANIEVIQSENLVQHSAQLGQVLSSQLKQLKDKHPCVGDVRSIGLFGIIELVKDRKTKEPLAPYNASSPEMKAISHSILEDHVYVTTHWHTIVMAPPLIIKEEQLLDGIRAIDKALIIGDKAVSG